MKVSIITVCKDAEKYLAKTIESVVSQTFTDFEYIVIDGASTDGTVKIIDDYRDKINKFISEPDNGIYDAMNKGIALSEGEYLMFLNAGDYFVNKNVLKEIIELNLNEDIIYGIGLIEFSNGFLFRKTFQSKVTKLFMFMDTIPHQDSLVKRDIFLKVGGFDIDLKIAGDYKFFLDAIFGFKAQAKYVRKFLAVNDLAGVSRKKELRESIRIERDKAIRKHLTENEFLIFKIIKPIYFVFFKYPKYLINYFQSLFLNREKLQNG